MAIIMYEYDNNYVRVWQYFCTSMTIIMYEYDNNYVRV